MSYSSCRCRYPAEVRLPYDPVPSCGWVYSLSNGTRKKTNACPDTGPELSGFCSGVLPRPESWVWILLPGIHKSRKLVFGKQYLWSEQLVIGQQFIKSYQLVIKGLVVWSVQPDVDKLNVLPKSKSKTNRGTGPSASTTYCATQVHCPSSISSGPSSSPDPGASATSPNKRSASTSWPPSSYYCPSQSGATSTMYLTTPKYSNIWDCNFLSAKRDVLQWLLLHIICTSTKCYEQQLCREHDDCDANTWCSDHWQLLHLLLFVCPGPTHPVGVICAPTTWFMMVRRGQCKYHAHCSPCRSTPLWMLSLVEGGWGSGTVQSPKSLPV